MTISFTLFITVAGIAYSITVAVYSLSDAQIKSMDAVYQQAFNDFFVLLNAGISILAWILFLSTAGTTTPWVATLFILAEAVFIIKELINLALFCWYETPSINRDASPDMQRHQARLSIEMEAHKKKSWVNLVCAVCRTGIIAGWCLAPENLVVGALLLIAMGVVYWERHDVIEQVEADMATALQAVVGELAPWWVDGNESRVESTAPVDVLASNEGLPDMDRCEDWHHRNALVSRGVSQGGLFSRKSDYNRVGNYAFFSGIQNNNSSIMG